jgi:uncharacterized protein (DUF486 family)
MPANLTSYLLPVLLLLGSNVFMTIAWYGHLKFRGWPMWLAIAVSWGIALFEYMLQVPANRIGYRSLSAYQLKIMQEAMTLVVFIIFARVALNEPLRLKYGISFGLMLVAVAVAFH